MHAWPDNQKRKVGFRASNGRMECMTMEKCFDGTEGVVGWTIALKFIEKCNFIITLVTDIIKFYINLSSYE